MSMMDDAPPNANAVPKRLTDISDALDNEEIGDAMREAANIITTLQAELAHLRSMIRNHLGDLDATAARTLKAEAQLARAQKALEPFAHAAGLIDSQGGDVSDTDECALSINGVPVASWPFTVFREARMARTER